MIVPVGNDIIFLFLPKIFRESANTECAKSGLKWLARWFDYLVTGGLRRSARCPLDHLH